MQLIWYLPSLVIGLTIGLSSGYWQLALISFLMVGLMAFVQVYKNRYPPFDDSSNYFLSAGAVAIGDRVLPRYEIFWKKSWHELLLVKVRASKAPNYLEQVLASKSDRGKFLDSSDSLSIWIGASNDSERYLNLAKDGPHTIIVGPTGSGKSELLKLAVASLIEAAGSLLALFDFKGGATLEAFRNQAVGLATDLDVAGQAKLWEFVAIELESRERAFANQRVSSIEQYNQRVGGLQELVVVIDEFAAALSSGAKALACIEDVTARGRSLGVHLIAATQSLTGIPRSMLTNFRIRIAMNSADPIDLVQLGMNPNKVIQPNVSGWAAATVMTSAAPAVGFYFPLGFIPKPKPAASTQVNEQPRPVRSQLLRQMYSNPEQETDLPGEPLSSPYSQLLSRMEGLR